MELRQEEIGHNLDHNTSLTQESWGMLSSMSYDWHHGVYYPPTTSRPVALSFVEAWGRDSQCPGKSSYPLVQLCLDVKKKREKRIAILRINVWKSVQALILEMMNSCSV